MVESFVNFCVKFLKMKCEFSKLEGLGLALEILFVKLGSGLGLVI